MGCAYSNAAREDSNEDGDKQNVRSKPQRTPASKPGRVKAAPGLHQVVIKLLPERAHEELSSNGSDGSIDLDEVELIQPPSWGNQDVFTGPATGAHPGARWPLTTSNWVHVRLHICNLSSIRPNSAIASRSGLVPDVMQQRCLCRAALPHDVLLRDDISEGLPCRRPHRAAVPWAASGLCLQRSAAWSGHR